MQISRPTILIVEDDEAIRSLLTVVAARLGMDTDTARNGAEAIARIEQGEQFCAIVLDLMMPGVDGYAVISYLARTFRLIPVVVVTAAVAASNRAHFDPLIVKAVVHKPFDLIKLEAAMEAACETLEPNPRRRPPTDFETA